MCLLWLTRRCLLVLKATGRNRLVPRQRLGCRTLVIALVCLVPAIMFRRLHACLRAMSLHAMSLHAMSLWQGQALIMNRPTMNRICPTMNRTWQGQALIMNRAWQGQVGVLMMLMVMPPPPRPRSVNICRQIICHGQSIHIHFLIPNAILPFKLPKPPCGWAPVPRPCMLPDDIT